jgi:tetratricopeptide (TPR) repeat protein
LAVNKRKILENARKLAQKGAQAKALKEYEKLVKLDPRDAKLRLEIGDAYRRWGQVDEAIDTYVKVADQYTREGFDARAVAVYKQIVNLDPDRTASYEPLADLYERMGLAAEAVSALQTAADSHHRQGRKREALELLRKMATMDPTNTTSRLKVAELLRQEGLNQEAVAEYAQVGQELDRQGDVEVACKIYRRLLELDPDHVEALARLGQGLLRAGKAPAAEALARRAVDLAPEEPTHYELLADVYRSLEREDALADVYRSLAELFRRRGDDDEARAILQRHVPPSAFAVEGEEIETLGGDALDDEAFLGEEELGAGDELLGEELIPGEGAPAVTLDTPSANDDPIVLDEPVESAAAGHVASHGLGPSAQASPAEPDCDPDQLLAEASVYLRYGKRDNAIAHLERILAVEPEHRLALEKLGEAHADAGDESRAVDVWVRAVKLAQQDADTDAVGVLRSRIRALDEEAANALEPTAPDPGPPDALDADQDSDFGIDVELDEEIEIDLDDAELDDAQPAVAIEPPRSSGIESASLSTATTQQLREDLEEADFYVQQGLLTEAEEIYKRVLSIAPNHPRALVRLGEVVAAQGGDPGAVATPVEEPQGRPADPDEIEASDELDTEDFDVSDIDLDLDAAAESLRDPEPELDMLEPVLTAPEPTPAAPEPVLTAPEPTPAAPEPVLTAPEPAPAAPEPTSATPEPMFDDVPPAAADDAEGEAGGIDLISEIGEFDELDETAVDSVGDEAEGEADGEGFDLAAELSGEFDADWASASQSGTAPGDDGFTAVFDAFKKGVSEALSEGDHDAHYDLGIAYKEMGLFDDAIGEFRAAMASASHRLGCLHLIGVCALEGGQPRVAIDHLEELMAAPEATDSQILAGRFDLGCAWEALDDRGRARDAFDAVAQVDATFRDVGARLAALEDGSPGPVEAPPEKDFESFEDMLLDEDDPGDDGQAEPALQRADPHAVAEECDEPDVDDPSVGPAMVREGDPTPAPLSESAHEATPDADGDARPGPPLPPAAPAHPDPPARATRRRKKKISFV